MGHTKNERDKAVNETKENKNKEKIEISWCSESGIWPHAGGRRGGCQTRGGGRSRVLLLLRVSGPPGARRCRPGARCQSCHPGHRPSFSEHGPIPGPLSSHGHLSLSEFSCDPASVSPGSYSRASKHPSALCSSITPTLIILFYESHSRFSTPAERS